MDKEGLARIYKKKKKEKRTETAVERRAVKARWHVNAKQKEKIPLKQTRDSAVDTG